MNANTDVLKGYIDFDQNTVVDAIPENNVWAKAFMVDYDTRGEKDVPILSGIFDGQDATCLGYEDASIGYNKRPVKSTFVEWAFRICQFNFLDTAYGKQLMASNGIINLPDQPAIVNLATTQICNNVETLLTNANASDPSTKVSFDGILTQVKAAGSGVIDEEYPATATKASDKVRFAYSKLPANIRANKSYAISMVVDPDLFDELQLEKSVDIITINENETYVDVRAESTSLRGLTNVTIWSGNTAMIGTGIIIASVKQNIWVTGSENMAGDSIYIDFEKNPFSAQIEKGGTATAGGRYWYGGASLWMGINMLQPEKVVYAHPAA